MESIEGANMGTEHAWKFYRMGGFDQVRLETGADLMAIRYFRLDHRQSDGSWDSKWQEEVT